MDTEQRLADLESVLDPPRAISGRRGSRPLTLPMSEITKLRAHLVQLAKLPESLAASALASVGEVAAEDPVLGRLVAAELALMSRLRPMQSLDEVLQTIERLSRAPRAVPAFLNQLEELERRLCGAGWREFLNRGLALVADKPTAAGAYFSLESRLAQETLGELESQARFEDRRQVLHLFAEAVAGLPVPLDTWDSAQAKSWREQLQAATTGAAAGTENSLGGSDGVRIFLPAMIDRFSDALLNRDVYITLTLRQLGLYLYGTLTFDVNRLFQRLGLESPQARSSSIETQTSSFSTFFSLTGLPEAAARLFTLLEEHRIAAHLGHDFPGFLVGNSRLAAAELEDLTLPSDAPESDAPESHGPGTHPLEVLRAMSLEQASQRAAKSAQFSSGDPALDRDLLDSLAVVSQSKANVYRSAEACWHLLERWPDVFSRDPGAIRLLPLEALEDRRDLSESASELQSLLDAAEELGQSKEELLGKLGLTAKDPFGALSLQDGDLFSLSGLLQADDDEDGPLGPEAQEPPGGRDKDPQDLEETLARVQDLGARIVAGQRQQARAEKAFRYDEWDYEIDDYRPDWCTLREIPLESDSTEDADFVRQVRLRLAGLGANVRKQLEQLKPELYRRQVRLIDGDELDLDSAIEAVTDLRARRPPSEKLYVRRNKQERDVAAVFLLDLSASTDEAVIDPEAPEEEPEESQDFDFVDILTGAKPLGLSDPSASSAPSAPDDSETDPLWGNWPPARIEPGEPKRRVIDVEREAVILMADALETLGDRYAVYGFSGYGRDNVEFFVAKDFDESWDEKAEDRVGAMRPRQSTRMGPAIRHALRKLDSQDAKVKALLMLSDGFPQDHDYGRDRNSHEHGIQDTMMALREAELRGIDSFCLTVDPAGHDYLRKMCPDRRYLVIEETAELPRELPKVYRGITS